MDLLVDDNEKFSKIEELHKIIEEKENDIKLAAEYGMSLLQNKLELEKQNDEYKEQIDALQHEVQMLKSQLESLRCVYEQNLSESRQETLKMEKTLEDERKSASKVEKQLQEKIQELMACNENLTEQMLNASMHEEETKHQINSLQLHVSEAEQDQGNIIANLKNEISDLRSELENRVALKTNECRILSTALDDATLENSQLKQEKEKDQIKIRTLKSEMHNLEDKYVMLLSKNEPTNQQLAPSMLCNENSLFAELDVLSNSLTCGTLPLQPGFRYTIGTQLKQEIMEVYRQIERLTMEVKGNGDLWSPEAVDISDLKAGQLLVSLTSLNALVNKRLQSTTSSPLYEEVAQLEANLTTTKDHLTSVKEELVSAHTNLESVKQELKTKNQQLQRKTQECEKLQIITIDLEKSRSELLNERDTMLELKYGINSNEAVYCLLRNERDEALKMNTKLQFELSKVQLDLEALDSQMIESVEQKLILSKQLEEWQSDMRDLIEDKMAEEIAKDKLQTKKLSPNDSSNNNAANKKASLANRKFSLRWS